jgi:DNA gyrase/topoisomerase IV subunit A
MSKTARESELSPLEVRDGECFSQLLRRRQAYERSPQAKPTRARLDQDDTTEMMVISQFGEIIRIDTKSVRSAGRSTSGVRLLNLDTDDKVASATVIPPEDPKVNGHDGTLLQ